jgi:anti-sigma regulatory factor (Ser/Thr protein kinase)
MTIQATLPTDAASVGTARGIVAGEMGSAGCTDESIDVARLLTSELATNAVRHAAGAPTYVLLVRIRAGLLHVEVTDTDPTSPRLLGRPTDDAEGGRGIWLVDHIAHRWGVETSPPGKRVWFEVRCDPG